MVVADKDVSLVLTGTGDVLEPEAGIVGIGSGGNYALAAARALADGPLDAEAIVRRSLDIAADICVYTNRNVTDRNVEERLNGVIVLRISSDDRRRFPNRPAMAGDAACGGMVGRSGRAIRAGERRPEPSRHGPIHRRTGPPAFCLPAMLRSERVGQSRFRRLAARRPRHRSVYRRRRHDRRRVTVPHWFGRLPTACSIRACRKS